MQGRNEPTQGRLSFQYYIGGAAIRTQYNIPGSGIRTDRFIGEIIDENGGVDKSAGYTKCGRKGYRCVTSSPDNHYAKSRIGVSDLIS